MSLFAELKKRNVFRVAAAYIVLAWLVIQVVETIFPAFGFGDAAVRLVVIVFAIGLIPVLVFSWLFELTPEGIKRESKVDHTQSVALTTVKRFDRAIIVILTLAVGFFAFDKFVLDQARDAELEKSTTERVRSEVLVESYGESSIAVMPFVNMSDDAGNEYFSDGIAEELLNLLARIPRLRVISQSSSFSFKGKEFTIPQVAEQLNVAFVLEGSVRKVGNQVRITAQLIEGRSDTHLWSDTYDRTLNDVFAIQDEISVAIVAALKGHLKLDIGVAPKATGTVSAEAHDAELRGRYLLAQRVPGARTSAAAEFEKAIALDPGFALAHAELAISLIFSGCGEMTDTQCLVKTAGHVEKALVLAPDLAEANAAKGWLSIFEDKPDDALVHFQRAVEINPNYALVYTWMANNKLFINQEEAFAAIERSLRLDPMSPVSNAAYVHNLLNRNRVAEANRQIEKYASIEPRFATLMRGSISSLGGNWAIFILSALEALKGGPEGLSFSWTAVDELMWHLAMIGLDEEALRMADGENVPLLGFLGYPEQAIELAQERLVESPSDPYTRFQAGFAFAHAGNYSQARPLLKKAWQYLGQSGRGQELGWVAAYVAQALIAVLRQTGDEAGARQVLAEFKDIIRRDRAAGITATRPDVSLDYFEGVAAYLSGEHESGLALISKAAEEGYWIRPPAAFQQAMYQDPGFVAILEKQKVLQAREREKVLAVACAADYPYADAWQPAEETCKRYFSAGHN